MNPYKYMKNAIIVGQYKPGTRLTEKALAEELQVSRTPIREAIKQLEVDGLITPYKKRGYVVKSFSIEDIRQIYNVRALLEGYATGEAAIMRTDEDIERITAKNKAYRQAIESVDREDIETIQYIQQINQQFHTEILAAARNDHLKALIERVVVVPIIFRSFYWYDERQLLRSLQVHETILQALRNRESDRARVAMQEHIYQGRDDVIHALQQQNILQDE
ncbi:MULTISPECIES: GntR family transcriptional regulator [Bhargavaea]|uniref:GntR family transcriptional regulator n=1 Tax=Bhargavaea changchunensis TaxID=2134037 RepID=A0ABW2NCN3_9BACL|nr:GntR family transcriptional regulator [Bhargavaea sp. CC-171006]